MVSSICSSFCLPGEGIGERECCALACRCIVLPTMLCVYRVVYPTIDPRWPATRLKPSGENVSARSRPISRRHRQRRPPLFSDNIALATGRKSRLRGASVQISNLPNRHRIVMLLLRRGEIARIVFAIWNANPDIHEKKRKKFERLAIKKCKYTTNQYWSI